MTALSIGNGLSVGYGLSASTALSRGSGFYFEGFNAEFSPASLFAAGEPGAWYDPSDMTTLFQDSAGTTPVTAVEQPVGRMLDKSGRNNHATQSTSASRPVLSARYNLLTKTEAFEDAVWTKSGINAFGSGSVANTTATLDPFGGNTADLITEDTTNATHNLGFTSGISATALTSYTTTFYFKRAIGVRNADIFLTSDFGGGGIVFGIFDLGAGTASVSVLVPGLTDVSASILSVGNDWFRCTLSFKTDSSPRSLRVYPELYNGNRSYTGDGTSGIYIWGADLRASTDGVGLPVYQRVNTATDYTTTGFPSYLRFDGVDDGMVTNTITPGVDKAQVFAGVRKLVDTTGMLSEFSANSSANSGSFYFTTGLDTGVLGANNGYVSTSRGTTSTNSSQSAQTIVAAPNTSVLAATHDISGDLSTIRRNTVSGTPGTGDKGPGNFLAYPLYIGRRGGTTLPFNGRLFPLIVRFGPNLTTDQITNTETWVNSKTQAYTP